MSHQSADLTRFGPPGPRGHLSAERLAALVEECPTPAEAGHLEGCLVCRRERDAVAAVIDAARTAPPRVGPPLTEWASLAAALRTEGLLDAPARDDGLSVPGPRLPAPDRSVSAADPADPADTWSATRAASSAGSAAGRSAVGAKAAIRLRPWLTRAAAAVVLLVGGAVLGRLSAGESPLPGLAAPAADRVVAAVGDTAATPRSSAEAMAVLARAERDYRMATAFLAAQADPTAGIAQPELYQRRLAVMDQVAALTRAALYETPHDPVLNQYYLASLGAREATLQQLNVALPQGTELNRF